MEKDLLMLAQESVNPSSRIESRVTTSSPFYNCITMDPLAIKRQRIACSIT
ncbi:unnamed protein product, partial [Nesidiocoris tenuis]